ncbi:MAG TPA: hypothetical protein VGF53_02000 [Pseudolabrys sp.]|jgi:hypothetical protein
MSSIFDAERSTVDDAIMPHATRHRRRAAAFNIRPLVFDRSPAARDYVTVAALVMPGLDPGIHDALPDTKALR